MEISAPAREQASDLLNFIDASPSPWHAVQTMADHLQQAGFSELREDERWHLAPSGRHFVIRCGASMGTNIGKPIFIVNGYSHIFYGRR